MHVYIVNMIDQDLMADQNEFEVFEDTVPMRCYKDIESAKQSVWKDIDEMIKEKLIYDYEHWSGVTTDPNMWKLLAQRFHGSDLIFEIRRIPVE